MKAYKGFNKDMTCKGFQYEEGKEYTHDGPVKACCAGFHACEDPIECFRYYAPAESVFHEVEQSGEISKGRYDSKIASSIIKVGGRIDVLGISKAHFEYVKAHTNFENTDPKQASAGEYGAASAGKHGAASAGGYGVASAGEYGVASAGESGAASSGESGAASAGESGAASAGESGAASAGGYGVASAGVYGAASAGKHGAASAGKHGAASAGKHGAASAGGYGVASAGEYGVASAGESGAASAGESGAASAGEYGAATSRGSSSVGKEGIACARGNNVKAKGGLGAVLVLVEENSNDYGIEAWNAGVVDGNRIKENTFYKLVNGEFVECCDEGERRDGNE